MAHTITINGTEKLADTDKVSYEKARAALFTLGTTQNPFADGILKSLSNLPQTPESFCEVLQASGNDNDVIEISEKPQGQKEWTVKARWTRGNFARRMLLTIHRKEYEGEILTTVSNKTESAGKEAGIVTEL